jgi:hypothetical protein
MRKVARGAVVAGLITHPASRANALTGVVDARGEAGSSR